MKHLYIIVMALCFISCKKTDDKASDEKPEFSFVYNGKTYYSSVTGDVSNAGVGGDENVQSIHIDMPEIFDGIIYFVEPGCAYMAPRNETIYVDTPDCKLSLNRGTTAIDSAKVYLYKSGKIDISVDKCVNKSETDIYTGQTGSYKVCRFSGTFELTLVNNKQEAIVITNGIIKNQYVRTN